MSLAQLLGNSAKTQRDISASLDIVNVENQLRFALGRPGACASSLRDQSGNAVRFDPAVPVSLPPPDSVTASRTPSANVVYAIALGASEYLRFNRKQPNLGYDNLTLTLNALDPNPADASSGEVARDRWAANLVLVGTKRTGVPVTRRVPVSLVTDRQTKEVVDCSLSSSPSSSGEWVSLACSGPSYGAYVTSSDGGSWCARIQCGTPGNQSLDDYCRAKGFQGFAGPCRGRTSKGLEFEGSVLTQSAVHASFNPFGRKMVTCFFALDCGHPPQEILCR